MNTVVFAIGNFGSKLLSFIMVPVYAHVLTTGEYGTVDFFQTTVWLLTPIIGLSIFEATLRFTMDNNESKSKVVSTSSIFTIIWAVFMLMLYFLCRSILHIEYLDYFVIIIFFNVFNTQMANYARGAGYSKIFALSGVGATLALVAANLLFLVEFDLGIYGYLISLIISSITSIIILSFFTNFWSMMRTRAFDKSLLKRMLKYSLPLMPSSISWWLTSDVNRFFIVLFLGVSANGEYAVATKPGAILTMVFTIFSQAWQLSATEEIESKDNTNFFSDIFLKVTQLHFIVMGMIIVTVHPLFRVLFGSGYQEAWRFVPILLFSVFYANLSNFIGVSYLANKKTLNILISTMGSAIVNVLLNIWLVPIFGINGAIVANVIAFFVLTIYRLVNSRKIVNIRLEKSFYVNQVLLVLLTLNVLYTSNEIFLLITNLIILSSIFVANRSVIPKFKN